jgi:hypothetical protein
VGEIARHSVFFSIEDVEQANEGVLVLESVEVGFGWISSRGGRC